VNALADAYRQAELPISLPILGRTLVLVAAGTGMRMSELLGLQWGDTDFAGKKIVLNQTWVYGRIENGKTEESREPVVLGERTTEFLREWHRQTPYAGKGDWVFASNKLRGKRPISGCQFVKDYIRPPRFVEHGLIDADYAGRAGLHAFRQTIHYLEESYRERAPQLVFLQSDPSFDFLHSDPRYRAIVNKMGLPPAYGPSTLTPAQR